MLQPAVEMQKKPGKPGFFDLPLCFGRESGPIGGPGRWGGSAAPSEPLRGPRAPFLQRNKGQTAQPPSPSLAQGEGVSLGSRGGGGIWRPGPKAPGCPMESPGRGAKGPRPGFSGRCAPPPPPRSAAVPTAEGRKGRGKGDRQNRRQDQMPLR